MSAWALPLLALALLACSSDATSPAPETGAPGIDILAGANVTDTVDTRIAAPLRVRVFDEGGKPLAGSEVRFKALLSDVPALKLRLVNVFVVSDRDPYPTDVVVDTTDADGYADAHVVLGRFAAPAAIAVTVPTHAFADTARYTVLAGKPANTIISPADTAVTAGAPFDVIAGISDRNGNPLPGAPTLRTTDVSLAVSTSGTVATTTPVRAAIIASSGTTRPDTTWVSVVPSGQMGAEVSWMLTVMELDGRGRSVIPTTLSASDPEWTLDGSTLLVQLAPTAPGGSLYRVDLNADATLVLRVGSPTGGVPSIAGEIWGFAPSSDGSLLVSSGGCNYMAILYRLPAGFASPLVRLSPPSSDDCFGTVHHFPSPSPDGARVVFEHRTNYFTGSSIRLLDPVTGTITPLNATGERPRWSPKGDLIAFSDQNRVWVIAPNGSGLRAISPAAHKYVTGVSWSPDGRWLLARYQSPLANGTIVAVLEVATGMELPLPYTQTAYLNNFGVPVWRPAP